MPTFDVRNISVRAASIWTGGKHLATGTARRPVSQVNSLLDHAELRPVQALMSHISSYLKPSLKLETRRSIPEPLGLFVHGGALLLVSR
eukprot:1067690-Amphidinium_carterae.1